MLIKIKINATIIFFLEKGSYKDRCVMDVYILKMLYHDRINASGGIDVNKTSASKECHICYYWYFLNYSFKFQPNVCHDLLMMSLNLSDIAKY